MTIAQGYDYSSWRPSSASELDGVDFVVRYLSNDSAKNLSLAEAQELTSWGKFIVVNWESDGLGGGFAQGVADAATAKALAIAFGWPGGDRPIIFSIDENVDPTTQDDYYKGIASVLPNEQIGIYGEAAVIERWRSFGAGWGFLTESTDWEGGSDISGCQLQQTGTDPGGNYDYDIALAADYGGWQVGGKTTAVTTTTTGTTTGTTSNEDEDMSQQSINGVAILAFAANQQPLIHVIEAVWNDEHTVAADLSLVYIQGGTPGADGVQATAPTQAGYGSATWQIPAAIQGTVRGVEVTNTKTSTPFAIFAA